MRTMRAWFAILMFAAMAPLSHGQQEAPAPDLETAPGPERLEVRYLEVPLTGGVGEEITAPGVRAAITHAKSRRATHIIFVIDTPGGRVDDANAIARILDEHRGDLKYIVVVKQCLSAGVWIMSRADEIFFTPQSTAGAAVAFKRSANTGSAEVDAKFNSALAASLAAAASERGQSPAVYRAMMIMDACLFAVTDAQGNLSLTDTRPQAGTFREIDSALSVLSLTAGLAAEIGFAQTLPSADIRSIAQIHGWDMQAVAPAATAQVQQGARMVKQRVEERERAEEAASAAAKRAAELLALVQPAVAKAGAADPARHRYYVRETGVFTPESQKDWRRRTDEAVARWNDVINLTGEINKETARYERATEDINKSLVREHETRLYDKKPDPIDFPEPEFKLQIKEIARTANENKNKLLASRNKNRL
jgi:hypothetical protein